MVEKKKTLELKKHVAAIHSSNKLSLLQRKIANALLFNAYDKLLQEDEHVIHIATLCNLIGYDSHDYKTIKKALVNLLATVIEWNLVDGDKLNTDGIWNASSIIADASIDGPLCSYSYSNKMKQLLHQPELYGRLNMLVQAKFKSSYGLALYENCIRFQRIEQTPWFALAKFRKLMGVEDNKYKIFRDFKNRVLAKAVEEVNKFSPITVIPQFRKQGRQVVAIQFLISTAHHKTALSENHVSEILKESFGLSKRQIQTVLSDYQTPYIKEKITLVESTSSFVAGKINNLGKYLLSALKEDYQPNKSSKNVNNIVKPKTVNVQLLDQYRRYQNKEIIKIFYEQSNRKQKSLLKEFEKHLGKSMYQDIYQRDGLKNILIQDQLCLFIRQNMPDMLQSIPSYEIFIQQANC